MNDCKKCKSQLCVVGHWQCTVVEKVAFCGKVKLI